MIFGVFILMGMFWIWGVNVKHRAAGNAHQIHPQLLGLGFEYGKGQFHTVSPFLPSGSRLMAYG